MDELIVNLWAAYDAETGFVYALSGKVYLVSGDEENKLRILKALARTDHLTAKRYQVPSRFEVIYTDGTVKKNVTSLDAIADPNANLFEEMFENLEADLPPLIFFRNNDLVEVKQRLPEAPLCVVTALYEDEEGNLSPITTDADREWVRVQEQLRGR